ncbi:hypothetical protein BDW75DRAFT_234007 [Aspergillus navahoensis]
MTTGQRLPLFRVHDEPRSIRAVANTLTTSFAHDPLITWLRPRVPPWTTIQTETFKWQYRRVQRAVAEGIILKSGPTAQIDGLFPARTAESSDTEPKVQGSVVDKSRSENEDRAEDEDAGVVVLLFPPLKRQKWTLERLLLLCKLRVLDTFRPVHEKGTKQQRLEMMMNSHDTVIDRIKKLDRLHDLWYLEVVAVHPALQGRSLGKKAMASVLDYVNHDPIVLECTSESNIPFYQKLGFKVVEEVELIEDGEAVRLWFMLRQASGKWAR